MYYDKGGCNGLQGNLAVISTFINNLKTLLRIILRPLAWAGIAATLTCFIAKVRI
jgi:hypothetical protein